MATAPIAAAGPLWEGWKLHLVAGVGYPLAAAGGALTAGGRTELESGLACDNQLHAGWALALQLQHEPSPDGWWWGGIFHVALLLIPSEIPQKKPRAPEAAFPRTSLLAAALGSPP